MAALTEDRKIQRKAGDLFHQPVAAAKKIYNGALVNVNASGYAKPAEDTSGEKFLGVSKETVDNSGGASGTLSFTGHKTGEYLFNASGMTQADVGKAAYIVDDNTVGVAVTNVKCGKIAQVDSTTKVWVDITR